MAGCDLGTIQYKYRKSHPMNAFLGHGQHGVRLDGKFATDYHGKLYADSDTLIHGDGGVGVEDGDTITHDAAACAQGLAEA